jgi:hypothetical protein
VSDGLWFYDDAPCCDAGETPCHNCTVLPRLLLGLSLETAAALTLNRRIGFARAWSNRDILDGLFSGTGDDCTYFPRAQSVRHS